MQNVPKCLCTDGIVVVVRQKGFDCFRQTKKPRAMRTRSSDEELFFRHYQVFLMLFLFNNATEKREEEDDDERRRMSEKIQISFFFFFYSSVPCVPSEREFTDRKKALGYDHFFHVPLSSLHLSRSSSPSILSVKKTTFPSWWPRCETFFFFFFL